MIGRVLAWGTSLLVLVVLLELGLRLVGFAPPVSVTEPDAELGWRNVAGRSFERSSSEYDVRFRFNSQGLRDDEIGARKDGERRVLVLGDSFVLGYTLEREQHFVDLLERGLAGIAPAGRSYRVINAGVEGFSTDQELLFLRRLREKDGLVDGASGDVVVLCTYMNDLYWLDQADYMGTPKPRLPFEDGGDLVRLEPERELHGQPRSWLRRNSAILHAFFSPQREPPRVEVAGVGEIYAERGIFLSQPPPYIESAVKRLDAILRRFRLYCEEQKLEYLVALIPHKAQVDRRAQGSSLGFPSGHPPVLARGTSVFADACRRAGIDGPHLLDPLSTEGGRVPFDAGAEAPLYYEHDWHFSPTGSARFATALGERLCSAEFLPELGSSTFAQVRSSATAPSPPLWPWVLGGIWLLLSLAYIRSYRDEKPWWAALKVALLLAFVAGLFSAVGALVQVLPPRIAALVPGVVVLLVLGFVLLAARRRVRTIFELFGAFIERGHWYMVPLLTVLLAIGTLLVVAASNPFVAPFIYTLF